MTTWLDGMPCAACGTPLAADQRYCLTCGTRRAGAHPDALALLAEPAAPSPQNSTATGGTSSSGSGAGPTAGGPAAVFAALRGGSDNGTLPPPRSVATLTAVVLGMGVLIGAAIGPAAVGSPDAAQRPIILVSGSGPSATTTTIPAPAPAAPALAAPSGNVTSDVGTLDDGGSSADSTETDDSSATTDDSSTSDDTGSTDDGDDTPTDDGGGKQTTTNDDDSDTTTLAGTVVHVNPSAQSFALADSSGVLSAIHTTAKLPKVGDELSADSTQLANGTYEATQITPQDTTARTAPIAGVVTAVDPQTGTYVVSGRGVSMQVTVPGWTPPPPPPATTTTPAPPPTTPPPPPATTPTTPPADTTPTTPTTTPTTPTDRTPTTPTTPTTTPTTPTDTSTTPAPSGGGGVGPDAAGSAFPTDRSSDFGTTDDAFSTDRSSDAFAAALGLAHRPRPASAKAIARQNAEQQRHAEAVFRRLARAHAKGHTSAASTDDTPATPTLPTVGHLVTLTAKIVPATTGANAVPAHLEEGERVDGDLAKGALPLEGIVRSVDPTQRIVTITADDLGTGTATLALKAPAAFKLDWITTDRSGAFAVTLASDGTLTLTGVASDDGSSGADNDALLQGKQKTQD